MKRHSGTRREGRGEDEPVTSDWVRLSLHRFFHILVVEGFHLKEITQGGLKTLCRGITPTSRHPATEFHNDVTLGRCGNPSKAWSVYKPPFFRILNISFSFFLPSSLPASLSLV